MPIFAQGTLSFTSGVNSGVTTTVGSAVAGSALNLIYPLAAEPAGAGDDALLGYFGYDHTPATCR